MYTWSRWYKFRLWFAWHIFPGKFYVRHLAEGPSNIVDDFYWDVRQKYDTK